jgi:hypothetical protein
VNSDFEGRPHIVFECLTISRTTCACKIGSISSWMITVFRWINFYTYLITELKKFAKLYHLTSFSLLRISVSGLCSSPSPNVTLDTVMLVSAGYSNKKNKKQQKSAVCEVKFFICYLIRKATYRYNII